MAVISHMSLANGANGDIGGAIYVGTGGAMAVAGCGLRAAPPSKMGGPKSKKRGQRRVVGAVYMSVRVATSDDGAAR
jgi:hypothetical protein